MTQWTTAKCKNAFCSRPPGPKHLFNAILPPLRAIFFVVVTDIGTRRVTRCKTNPICGPLSKGGDKGSVSVIMTSIGISVVENFCLELKGNFSLACVWDDSHFFWTSHFHLASPTIHLSLTALLAASSPSPASSPSRLLLEACCSAAPSLPHLTFRALSPPPHRLPWRPLWRDVIWQRITRGRGCDLVPRRHVLSDHTCARVENPERNIGYWSPQHSYKAVILMEKASAPSFSRKNSLDPNLIYTQLHLSFSVTHSLYLFAISTSHEFKSQWTVCRTQVYSFLHLSGQEHRQNILKDWFQNMSWMVIRWTLCHIWGRPISLTCEIWTEVAKVFTFCT